jgi:hypothetical protein
MNRSLVLCGFIVCSSLASGSDEPYAVIDTTDWNKVEAYAAPVTIASIDGQDYLSETRRTITPGKHTIEFVTTRMVKSSKIRETRTVELDAKPCTTYYFYAQHKSKHSPEWELKLLRETTLKDCGA